MDVPASGRRVGTARVTAVLWHHHASARKCLSTQLSTSHILTWVHSVDCAAAALAASAAAAKKRKLNGMAAEPIVHMETDEELARRLHEELNASMTRHVSRRTASGTLPSRTNSAALPSRTNSSAVPSRTTSGALPSAASANGVYPHPEQRGRGKEQQQQQQQQHGAKGSGTPVRNGKHVVKQEQAHDSQHPHANGNTSPSAVKQEAVEGGRARNGETQQNGEQPTRKRNGMSRELQRLMTDMVRSRPAGSSKQQNEESSSDSESSSSDDEQDHGTKEEGTSGHGHAAPMDTDGPKAGMETAGTAPAAAASAGRAKADEQASTSGSSSEEDEEEGDRRRGHRARRQQQQQQQQHQQDSKELVNKHLVAPHLQARVSGPATHNWVSTHHIYLSACTCQAHKD